MKIVLIAVAKLVSSLIEESAPRARLVHDGCHGNRRKVSLFEMFASFIVKYRSATTKQMLAVRQNRERDFKNLASENSSYKIRLQK